MANCNSINNNDKDINNKNNSSKDINDNNNYKLFILVIFNDLFCNNNNSNTISSSY